MANPQPESASQTLRVAVADGSYLVREAIAYVLGSTPGVEVVASCEDGEALTAAIERQHPCVVVVSVRIAGSSVAEVEQPGLGLVLVGTEVDARDALTWLDRDAACRAVLRVDRLRDVHYLVNAVRMVAAGGTFVDPEIAPR